MTNTFLDKDKKMLEERNPRRCRVCGHVTLSNPRRRINRYLLVLLSIFIFSVAPCVDDLNQYIDIVIDQPSIDYNTEL